MDVVYGSGPLIRGFSPTEDYQFTLVPQQTTSSGGGTPGTQRDLNVLQFAGVVVDSVFNVQFSDSLAYPGATIANLTPSIATFSDSTPAIWVSNGIAQVQASHPRLGNRVISAIVNRNASAAITEFSSYLSASLGYALSNQIDSAIAGTTPSAGNADALSSLTIGSSATRNSGLWCAGLVNLTGIPVWMNKQVNFTGALVTPRHVLGALHVTPSGTLAWLGSDGVIQTATVIDTSANHGGIVNGSDLVLCYLGSAIDTTKVKPFSVFPANAFLTSGACALPSIGNPANVSGLVPLPLMHWNQKQEVILLDWTTWDSYALEATFQAPSASEPTRNAWGRSPAMGTYGVVSGDSGSPVFTVMPNDAAKAPVLIGCCHTAGSAPNPAATLTQLNAMLNTLASANGDHNSYSLTQADLSAYSTY